MSKLVRYYNVKEDEKSEEIKPVEERKRPKKVVTYDVKVRPQKWGRRQADRMEKFGKNIKSNPRFRGKVPIPEEALEKHSRGDGLSKEGIRTTTFRKKFEAREKNFKFAHQQAARTEILLPEEEGFLTADPGETTTQFTQEDLIKNVDITTAAKAFDLSLRDFGPYRFKYTRNGRHLLLGGKKGHVAAFDWVTKKLHCELNVMEDVHDVSWFHLETMFAVAQKNWVYIYDSQGIELHCIKRLHNVTRMEFLPYHFLLGTASDTGFLKWLDVSIGQIASECNTYLGRLTMLTQNPYNAVLCLGHAKGVVSMWAPNSNKPLAKMLCHKAPMTALHVDPKGLYMATAATDKSLKIWDIRQLEGPLQTYKLQTSANNLAYSQQSLLAVGMGNIVEVYKDCSSLVSSKRPYLRHRFNNSIGNMNFCPFEDILGVATDKGFESLIVPGAGEPNFDALEINPYQSKSQRREAEVKALLEKIQPEMITLDPTIIAEVDVPTLKDKIDARKKLLFVKPSKIDYEPRRKAKGRGGSVKIAQNKKIVNEQAKREFLKNTKGLKVLPKHETKKLGTGGVLDRFLPKK